MAKISVIVPVYNGEKTIERCLNSLLAQTFCDLEIILVNDGSDDNSLSLIKRYAQADERIILIDKANGGVSRARNDGIARASGEYIAFMDADDEACPTLYARLYETARRENADMTFCGFTKIQNGREVSFYEPLEKAKQKKALPFFRTDKQNNVMGSVWRILFQSSLAKTVRFDEEVYVAEDLLYVLTCLQAAEKIAVLDEKLYRYFEPASITRKYFKADFIAQNKTVCSKLVTLLEKFGEEKLIKKQLFNTYTVCVCQTLLSAANPRAEIKKLNADPFFKNARKTKNFLAALRYCGVKEKIRFTLVYAKMYAILSKIAAQRSGK